MAVLGNFSVGVVDSEIHRSADWRDPGVGVYHRRCRVDHHGCWRNNRRAPGDFGGNDDVYVIFWVTI